MFIYDNDPLNNLLWCQNSADKNMNVDKFNLKTKRVQKKIVDENFNDVEKINQRIRSDG